MPTEALTTKIKGPKLDPLKSNTQKTQEYEACSYCYIVVRCNGQTEAPVVYHGPNAEHFLEALQKEERKIKAVLANPQAMHMTWENRRAYNSATTCHACEKPLAGDTVRYHCHITRQYQEAANNACNLKLCLNPKTTPIPVVFHNVQLWLPPANAGHFKGGSLLHTQKHRKVHIIIPGAAALYWQRSVSASISWQAGCSEPAWGFPDHSTTWVERDKTQTDHVQGCVSLPVYGLLGVLWGDPAPTQGGLLWQAIRWEHNEADYAHARQVWTTFGCKTLGDYSSLYCRIDVLLLADVFKIFLKTCLCQYGLDPAPYYTSQASARTPCSRRQALS